MHVDNHELKAPFKFKFYKGVFITLRKFFIVVVISLMVIVGQANFCNASMPYSEMYLGGFTVGSSYSAMKKMYGEPVTDKDHAEDNYTCNYGDSVNVGYNRYTDEIQHIKISANNGWKTPAGLAVGMNISDALNMYGNPDYKKVGSSKSAYCYFYINQQGTIKHGFIILFDKDSGKILQLVLIGGNSMATFEDIYQSLIDRMIK